MLLGLMLKRQYIGFVKFNAEACPNRRMPVITNLCHRTLSILIASLLTKRERSGKFALHLYYLCSYLFIETQLVHSVRYTVQLKWPAAGLMI